MGGHHHHHHAHDHHHAHHHRHGAHCPSQNANRKRLGIAAILIGLFMIVEVWGGIISGSLALLADAGHMMTDFAALSLAWLAFLLAEKPTTSDRPFGFKRVPVLAAFMNGLTLILIAIWIVKEAIHRFNHDVHDVLPTPMLIIATLGLVINIIVFVILLGADKENLNIRGAILHVIGDMLGSAAAIIAALIIMTTGFTPIDPILSVLVAVLIAWSAYGLVKDSFHVLIQGTPQHINPDDLKEKIVSGHDGILSVEDLKIWSVSQGEPVLSARIKTSKEADHKALARHLRDHVFEELHIQDITLEFSS